MFPAACTTSEARAIPNAHVTGIMLPLTVAVGVDGDSSEYAQRCLGRGMPDFLNLLRRAFARPSPTTLWKGAVRIFVGSVRKAAPMEENIAFGSLPQDDVQRCMR